VFIEAKVDGGGDDNWSYKSCKAPSYHRHHQINTKFFTGRMPFLLMILLYGV